MQGLECTECKDGYYNLQGSNPSGCDSCDCNLDGVIGGLKTCDKVTGQCPCKLYVTGRRCTSCKAGFYGLAGSKVFGCTGLFVANTIGVITFIIAFLLVAVIFSVVANYNILLLPTYEHPSGRYSVQGNSLGLNKNVIHLIMYKCINKANDTQCSLQHLTFNFILLLNKGFERSRHVDAMMH